MECGKIFKELRYLNEHSSMRGGLAMVMTRLAIKDKTFIRNNPQKLVVVFQKPPEHCGENNQIIEKQPISSKILTKLIMMYGSNKLISDNKL
uniref:Uncharacterized protein n=1 Tax=Romanomermis culicivorax TaxID=13658 RepID=A0A915J5Q7_ROMCU